MFAEANKAAAQELSEVPLEHLEHEICELAAHIGAGTARWLSLVAEFDRRQGHWSWGLATCAQWISWRCAISPRAAREQVRVARALTELPQIRETFSRGELSYSKVRALSRVATEENEADFIEFAGHATAAQLERILRGHRRVRRIDDEPLHPDPFLTTYWDEDGSLCLRGRLSAEDGALLVSALDAARQEIWEEDREGTEPGGSMHPQGGQRGSAEPPAPMRATSAQALVRLAQRGARKQRVTVHVDLRALTQDSEGRSHLEDGPFLEPEVVRRLGCDAEVLSLIESPDGRVLSVGRRTRSIPSAMRAALDSRDQGCRFPGCERRRFLDGHHVHHWAHGGDTSLGNLVLLCRAHHRLVHEGSFSVSLGKDGSARFRRPDGSVIEDDPVARGDPARLPHGAGLMPGTGERYDFGMAVERAFSLA
jgi:Domain of unknown function (DUF222)/HNH endonuclease